MTSHVIIRTVRASDADGLVPLYAALSHPSTAAQVRGRLERLTGDPTYGFWVGEAASGELLGFAAGHLLFPVEDDTPAAQLIALVTAEDARGRGLGTALCAAFEAWAVERGAARTMLNSSARRTEAHAFYTRRGYTASGVRFSKPL
ncbi:GNAT family N-acetyltransferase [Nocardiopsis dassonvillei]|uniref:GNAT family N-acetyltransferase n=1 Tax=Nocardiopsis dassonvillei TaxID=2014 RepID=UPI0008FCB543|nr:GNAT family N-acetyltransferase [Nocardiopsis dassonvillei]APC35686.1 GNAT family N-acetyltransferase [Nocardiopsis dassonvillei]